jgi:hypothetical protein
MSNMPMPNSGSDEDDDMHMGDDEGVSFDESESQSAHVVVIAHDAQSGRRDHLNGEGQRKEGQSEHNEVQTKQEAHDDQRASQTELLVLL